MNKREYTQGICQDGAAILCNGEQITIEEILKRLRGLEEVNTAIGATHEIDPSNYNEAEAVYFSNCFEEVWNILLAVFPDPNKPPERTTKED